jgi:thymidylate synthase (FAD)
VSNKQASDGEIDPADSEKFSALLTEHYDRSFALYQEALEAGVAKELARLFLPGFSVYYTWVVKVDAHNLMHWISLRMADDAQFEIRVFAEVIYHEIFKKVLPWTAEAFEKFRLPKPAKS